VEWPEYKEGEEQFLVIKPSMEVQSKMRPEQMAVWNSILPSLESESSPGTKNSITRNKNKSKKKTKKNQKHKSKFGKKPLSKPIALV